MNDPDWEQAKVEHEKLVSFFNDVQRTNEALVDVAARQSRMIDILLERLSERKD